MPLRGPWFSPVFRCFISLTLLILVGGCHPSGDAGTVRLAAAASLRLAAEEIATAFERGNPDTSILINAAASGALRRQIENGRGADVFISANVRHMSALVESGRVLADTRRDFLSNSLIVAAHRGDSPPITSLSDLTGGHFQRIAIGAPETAPVGRYAQEALEVTGVWDTLQPRLIFAESAPQIATYLQRGEVDAGILYATDIEPYTDSIESVFVVDPSLHSPIVYQIGVVEDAAQMDLAMAFWEFACGPDAQEIWRRHGFTPIVTAPAN